MKKRILAGIVLGVYMFIMMCVSVAVFTPNSTDGKAKLHPRLVEQLYHEVD